MRSALWGKRQRDGLAIRKSAQRMVKALFDTNAWSTTQCVPQARIELQRLTNGEGKSSIIT